jgi:hypothetical protein
MNVPILNNGIIDLVAVQNAITLILLDDDRLALVPVLPEIKLHQEADIMVDTVWTTPRSALTVTPNGVEVNFAGDGKGPVGAGLLVEMIEAVCPANQLSGPPLTWKIHVVSFEERNTNLTPGTGIGIMSEQLAQIVLDALHGLFITGMGALQASAAPIQPAHDWMTLKPGLFATRTTVEATVKRQQRAAVVNVTGIWTVDSLALACTDGAAAIYFTTDGSMPVASNPNATLYAAPVSVASGTVVLAAARKAGSSISNILPFIAP